VGLSLEQSLGMRLGHGLSLLSERVGEGGWTLPLEIGWIPPRSDPITYGVAQLEEFVKRHGMTRGHCPPLTLKRS
jgi:hypothetical protein